MAPGADLYLAGINSLSGTYLDNAVKKIVQYADNNNLPVVVSNSWGSSLGPRDGTGDEADVYNTLFGDNYPNHIALFASSNDGGKSKDNEGGGYHVKGSSSSNNPLGTIVRSATYSNTDAGYFYTGIIADACCQSTSVSSLVFKVLVLNSSTGAVVASTTVTPSTSGTSVSGLSTYYSGTLSAAKITTSSGKTEVVLYSNNGITSRSTSTTTNNGSTYYVSKYTLALQVYPSSGSAVIDMWGGSYGYFTNYLSTSDYTWTNGSDDMCVSDEATMPNVISVGAYVSKNRITDSSNSTHDFSGVYTLGDIAYFSSYATADQSPTGLQYPWITAPGARLVSGVNHYHTSSVDSYSYYGSDYSDDLVVNSSSNPYAAMEGTSMATPAAAGIVALWLQAAKEAGKQLTVNDVKTVMKETAIHDNFTDTGANASHFGNGKIDALAGIQYILGATGGPTITANPTSLSFEGFATKTYTQEITVRGINLVGNITARLTNGNGVYSLDKNTITAAAAADGVSLTITWSPQTAGTTQATVTLSSTDAENVVINITGIAEAATPTILADKTDLNFSTGLNTDQVQTINVSGRFLQGNVSIALTDANHVFSVSPTVLTASQTEEGTDVIVTFNSEEEGTFSGTLTLSSEGAQPVIVNLEAIANDGGTASDTYLNITKYQTIDEAGWSNTYVNQLYNYQEYENEEAAWLTLPLYGAWVGVHYNNHSQTWIESSLGTSNTYGGTSWNSSDVFKGSGTYFTGSSGAGSPRAIGYNSRTNTSIRSVSFYVTNTNAVKLYGTGRSGASSSYPATLKITECTVNADGRLTENTSNPKTQTSSSTSTFTLTINDLDPTKIYKVETSIYRGYLYEIGFRTPIQIERTPVINPSVAEMVMETPVGSSHTESFIIRGSNLTGNVTATLSDSNDVFDISRTSFSATEVESSNGVAINVTFTPKAASTYEGATITLLSEGANSIVIPLTGVGLLPELSAEPSSLYFDGTIGESITETFDVSGSHLSGEVAVSLEDENNVFSIDTNNISISDAEESKTVSVTFSPTQHGILSATVTLSSPYAESVTVTLNGKATEGYYDVSVGSAGLVPLYLDFPVRIPYEEYDPDLLGVYYAYSVENKSIKLARIYNTIPAYTGVIVHANSGVYRFSKINESEVTPLPRENFFTGTIEETTTSAVLAAAQSNGHVYVLGKGDSYICYIRYSGKIPAYKSFLIYDDTSNTNTLSLGGFGENTNGITNIIEETDDVWYTVQGVKLKGKPSVPGIYIKNGKTITIK